jgi:hypothetical protein
VKAPFLCYTVAKVLIDAFVQKLKPQKMERRFEVNNEGEGISIHHHESS